MRVGTRTQSRLTDRATTDHPHACGDKGGNGAWWVILLGSSPCVWGQAATVSPTAAGTGIIPMRVGTSSVEHQLPQISQDHPHACGDKWYSWQRL